jgi:predicted lactoylglutathione lyase
MNTQIFINLPVADVSRSIAFFKTLGFTHNPQFTDGSGACIVISEHIHVMVLTHSKFSGFTPRNICDTSKSVEVLNCLSCESRAEVDASVSKAVSAGGTIYAEPIDYSFMSMHSFADPDGHCWKLFHMTPGTIFPESQTA